VLVVWGEKGEAEIIPELHMKNTRVINRLYCNLKVQNKIKKGGG